MGRFQPTLDKIIVVNDKITPYHNEEDLDNVERDSQDKIKDLKDQLLRSLAENENLRKRTAKEIEQIKKYGHISLLREFLSVVDNMERAVKSSTSENQSETGVKNLPRIRWVVSNKCF